MHDIFGHNGCYRQTLRFLAMLYRHPNYSHGAGELPEFLSIGNVLLCIQQHNEICLVLSFGRYNVQCPLTFCLISLNINTVSLGVV